MASALKSKFLIWRMRRDQHGNNRYLMTDFVEILEVESVIPYLLYCGPKKGCFTDLELKNEHDVANKKYHVGSAP